MKLHVNSLTNNNAEKLLARSIITYNLPQRRYPIWQQLLGYRLLLQLKAPLSRLARRRF